MANSIDISNAELVILKVLWQQSPLLSADVVTQVQRTESWHEKTIKTLLNRLVKKHAIDFHKEGRAYLYFPRVSEHDYQKQVSSSVVDRVFSGRVSGLVAGFAEQRSLTAEDVDSLKSLIASWEQKVGAENE